MPCRRARCAQRARHAAARFYMLAAAFAFFLPRLRHAMPDAIYCAIDDTLLPPLRDCRAYAAITLPP